MKKFCVDGSILVGGAQELREYEGLEIAIEIHPSPLGASPKLPEDQGDEWEVLIGTRGGKIYNIEKKPYYLNNGYWQMVGNVNGKDYEKWATNGIKKIRELSWAEAEA